MQHRLKVGKQVLRIKYLKLASLLLINFTPDSAKDVEASVYRNSYSNSVS